MSKIEAHIKVQRFCKYVLKQNVGLIDRKKLFPTMLLQDKIKEKIEENGDGSLLVTIEEDGNELGDSEWTYYNLINNSTSQNLI